LCLGYLQMRGTTWNAKLVSQVGALEEFLRLLRNKRCCVAQQRGGWLRKAAGGVVSSKERSAHLLLEKCAFFKWEVCTSS
jgi:hypothetical protein